MNHPKIDSELETTTEKSVEIGAAKIGRRLGLTLYYVLLIYIIGASSISIIPKIFSSSPPVIGKAKAELHCANEIGALKNELLDKIGDFMTQNKNTNQRQWFVRWDKRFRMLDKGCGSLETTRIELRKLRDDLESMLERFHRKITPLINKIDKALMGVAESTH